MAKAGRLELRITSELLERVDAARGDVSRTRWVERALEKALGLPSRGDAPGVGGESRGPGVSTPASSRASVPGPGGQGGPESLLPVAKPAAPAPSKVYACPKAGCMFSSSEPGVCVHHRTERLR